MLLLHHGLVAVVAAVVAGRELLIGENRVRQQGVLQDQADAGTQGVRQQRPVVVVAAAAVVVAAAAVVVVETR